MADKKVNVIEKVKQYREQVLLKQLEEENSPCFNAPVEFETLKEQDQLEWVMKYKESLEQVK